MVTITRGMSCGDHYQGDESCGDQYQGDAYQNMPMYNVRLGVYFFLLCHTAKIL